MLPSAKIDSHRKLSIMIINAMMFITIPTWIAVPLIQDGSINLIEAVPFLILCLVGLVLAGIFFGSVQDVKR